MQPITRPKNEKLVRSYLDESLGDSERQCSLHGLSASTTAVVQRTRNLYESVNSFLNLLWRMHRRQLHPYAGLALWNHGVAEANDIHTLIQKGIGHLDSLDLIVEHDWNYGSSMTFIVPPATAGANVLEKR